MKKEISFEELVMEMVNYAAEIGQVAKPCSKCKRCDTAVIVEGICAMCWLQGNQNEAIQ